jgi:flavorubredoxin
MKGLKPLNKIGAAFGSYGWSGEAVKLINKELQDMKFDVIDPGIRIQYVPENKGLEACFELGQKIGQAVNERI